MDSTRQITLLLTGMKAGDEACHSQFVNAVYPDLKRIAAKQLRGEPVGNSMQPSALVNELYLRLMGPNQCSWENRAHFFACAASTMRRILIDRARSRRSLKREGNLKRIEIDKVPHLANLEEDIEVERLLALDAALDELATLDARQARLVEMRFFSGLTFEEAAMVLGISSRTAKRDWNMARAWLHTKTLGAAAS